MGEDGGGQFNAIGKYKLVAELGHGGMADVYLAAGSGVGGFNKLIVLKLLRNLDEPEHVQMFLDEARLAARLNHPNVVQTYEVGNEGELYFMAMEFLDGPSFNRVRKRAAKDAGRVPLPVSLHVCSRVLEGLHYAHELKDYDGTPLSVVHRDLSPHNVLVTYEGDCKVVDFGIAKAVDSNVQTQSGLFKGKITYMPPEQVNGEKVDRRADVFNVGIMLYEAVADVRFWGKAPETVIAQKLARGEVPRLADAGAGAPPALVELVDWALAPDPAKRCPTALELQKGLDAYVRREGLDVPRREVGEYVARYFGPDREALRRTIEAQLAALRAPGGAGALPVRLAHASQGGSHTGSSVSSIAPGHGGSSSGTTLPAAGGPTAPGGERRKGMIVGGALCGAALLAAFAVMRLTAPAPPASSAAPLPPVVAAPAPQPGPAAQPEAETVEVEVRVSPAAASLWLDERPRAGNPYQGRFPRDERPHQLRVAADGFVTSTREIRLDKDQAIVLVLERQPEPALPAATAKPKPKPKPKQKDPGQPDDLGF